MRSSYETYSNVAEECSHYSPVDQEYAFKASMVDASSNPSCCYCAHFAPGEYCRLDLYDKIVKTI